MRKALLSLGLLALASTTAAAQTQTAAPVACGGDLQTFLEGVKAEAIARGVPAEAADHALAGAAIDQKVLSRDRAQSVFKQSFTEFSKRTVSKSRLDIGAKKMREYAEIFARAEQEFGVPAPVITAFWAMETDFGAVQGDFNAQCPGDARP
ncbi:Membrane-bound lytic murein transglycosylase B precursor [Sinorhizobium alkalisoli]|nr:Membrane-bound lytic murein transglycosylase B precursor [Sinorhizobium alkalisoli]